VRANSTCTSIGKDADALAQATKLDGRTSIGLAAVKKRYDPGGLFFTHHGVGSDEWSANGFTRLRT
jgi:hypothetical protein